MDEKTRRRSRMRSSERWQKQIVNSGRTLWKLLKTYKNGTFTCILLAVLVLLLFGLTSLLPVPANDIAPGGTTTIRYSELIKQINAGNVMAVSIQGEDVNALLKLPLGQNRTSILQPQSAQDVEKSTDYLTWSYIIEPTASTDKNTLSADRAVYVHISADANTLLMSSLEHNHILTRTQPPASPDYWALDLLIRVAPVILIVVFLIAFRVIRKRQNQDQAIDQHVSFLGKNRARGFERFKEANPLQARKRSATTPVRRSGQAQKSASRAISTIPSVTFADVAGIDEVRAELSEIVQYLRSSQRYNRLGAHIPRGALLVGPPGTGKTLLARAVAGEAGVPFFSMSASEFVEMYVGVGASRVRDLFNQARQVAPCVIFIDELDAVGRKRTMRASGNDERDQTLNQLLIELDGFDERQAVVVLAATNRVDILDKALLRPGRFDRHITVSPPDRVGREAILKVHTRRTPLHEDVSLERLARLTTGMTGADLANLVNESALCAARRELDCVNHVCFEDALARVQLGALRPLVMSEHERRIIAVHEGGHALVAYHLPEADSVNRVTILPRGQSLGVTQFTSEVDRYNYSRENLMARIAVGLGGRVAEELTFGVQQVTTGAENDLQVVTDLARRMVTRWGMSEQVGVIFADYRPEEGQFLNMNLLEPDAVSRSCTLIADAQGRLHLNASMTAGRQHLYATVASASRTTGGMAMNSLIDAEVQRILNEGRDIARKILQEHNDQLTLLANALIEHEQLDRAQFEALF